MAIKGKGKTKRRGVTSAPKPVYVKPKKPLLARRGFQIGVLTVIVLGALAGFLTGWLIERHNNHEKAVQAAEKSIVQKFGSQVDTALQGVGQPFQTSFQAFPDLGSDITKLQSGDLSPHDAIKDARGFQSDAKDAYDAIQKIETAQLIEGHADLLGLSDAQSLLTDALNTYQQVAVSLRLAAQADGRQQKALIEHTQDLSTVAAQIFQDGYQKLVNERSRFGLVSPVPPSTGGLPTGG